MYKVSSKGNHYLLKLEHMVKNSFNSLAKKKGRSWAINDLCSEIKMNLSTESKKWRGKNLIKIKSATMENSMEIS